MNRASVVSGEAPGALWQAQQIQKRGPGLCRGLFFIYGSVVDEPLKNGYYIEDKDGNVNCVHVNGTATLHENAQVTVVAGDHGKEEQNKTDGQDAAYVRDKQKSE